MEISRGVGLGASTLVTEFMFIMCWPAQPSSISGQQNLIQYYFFQGSHSIEELLQKSDAIVPKERRKTTPVALKATAGLRLLPSNSSKQLLEEVITLINQLRSRMLFIWPKIPVCIMEIFSGEGTCIYQNFWNFRKRGNHLIYTKHVWIKLISENDCILKMTSQWL